MPEQTFVAFSLQARQLKSHTPIGSWELTQNDVTDAKGGITMDVENTSCRDGSVILSTKAGNPRTDISAKWTPPPDFLGDAKV